MRCLHRTGPLSSRQVRKCRFSWERRHRTPSSRKRVRGNGCLGPTQQLQTIFPAELQIAHEAQPDPDRHGFRLPPPDTRLRLLTPAKIQLRG